MAHQADIADGVIQLILNLVARDEIKLTAATLLEAARFLREIEVAAQLQHPHIVPLYDSGSAADLLYYVMPYVDGETLRERLAREFRLPMGDALGIAAEISDALAHAHRHNIVHRDIKPENILLQDDLF